MDRGHRPRTSLYLNSIKIYQWIFCILGLTPPPSLATGLLPKYQELAIYIIYVFYRLTLIVVVVLVHYLYIDIIRRGVELYNADTLTKMLSYSQNMALTIVHIVNISQSFVRFRNYKDIMQMIEQLEYDIETQHVKISPISWKIFKISGCSLLIMMTTFLYINYLLLSPTMVTNDKLVVLFFIVPMQIKCIEYGIYIQIVSAFLEHLLTSLDNLKADIVNFPQLPWSLLWQLIKNQMLLNRVWILVKTLEKYFAWPILFIFCHNGISVLATVNWAYVRRIADTSPLYPYLRLGYILIFLINLLIICCLAERCTEQYNKIGSVIHNLNIVCSDRALLMRIREYSLQLQHQQLLFSCSGFLDINLRNFGKMLLILSGYLVISVQFQLDASYKGSSFGAQNIFGKPV